MSRLILSRSFPVALTRAARTFIVAATASALVLGFSAPALPQAQRQPTPAESTVPVAPSPAATGSGNAGEAAGEALTAQGLAQLPWPTESVRRSTPEPARKLPADAVSEHALDLPGRTLRFKATAGSIPLFDADSGKLEAELAYTAFVTSEPAGGRPVTFLFNGGPGAASAYLNIGALGPWRLPLDGATASASSALLPNAETWLDFTDLVFIDPPGTGYSRLNGGDELRRQYWSVDGDAEAIAVFIRKWIEQNGRQRAAKFLVGESYGGMRALKVARLLEKSQGVGVRGMVLVSPVLDFGNFGQRRHAPLSFASYLPSMAATAQELNGHFDRAALAGVEAYASGDYLADLMRGERDPAAVERITGRLATLTGLDPALIKRLGGRIDIGTFQREIYRGRGLVGSAYDATVTAFDPAPMAAETSYPDPVLDATKAPLTSAMTELYQSVLNWRVDKPYQILNGEISGRWNWGRGRAPVQVVDELRTVLASDRRLQLLIVHGASDLVTPYFANKLILDQLPVYGSPSRAKLAVYGGGHMFYSRDASRRELRRDAEALYRAALAPEATADRAGSGAADTTRAP